MLSPQLTTQLARLARNPAVADSLAAACRETAADRPMIAAAALDVMRASAVYPVPDRWVLSLADRL